MTRKLLLLLVALTTLLQAAEKEPEIQDLYTYRAVVTRVIDGDTIKLSISLGFNVWVHDQSIRLSGVFAPETRSGSVEERASGAKVRDFVSSLLKMDKAVIVKTEKDSTDKYGRYLGTIWIDGESLNEKILKFMTDNGISKGGKGVKP